MFDGFVLWLQSVYMLCPKCHNLTHRPIYICEKCGTEHRNLLPWFGGIFYRKCSCGKYLPTTRILGRTDLIAVCPDPACGQVLGRRAEDSQIIAFSVVGGPSSGKTAFLMAAVNELTGKIARFRRWNIEIPLPGDRTSAERWTYFIDNGIAPQKTNIRQPTAFTLEILNDGLREKKRINFYDPAGEVFKESGSLSGHLYHRFIEGVVFIIDPFTIPELARMYRNHLDQKRGVLEVIEKSPEDYCEALIISLERDHQLSKNKLQNAPCAIVLSKSDAFNLDDLIGTAAARNLMERYPQMSIEDALDAVCRGALVQWGMGNLLSLLEDHFGECRCFSVSAFGHSKDEIKPFQPQRVELPLLWLLDRAGIDSRMGKEGVLLSLLMIVLIGGLMLFFIWWKLR